MRTHALSVLLLIGLITACTPNHPTQVPTASFTQTSTPIIAPTPTTPAVIAPNLEKLEPSYKVAAFYYPWYGNPTLDGKGMAVYLTRFLITALAVPTNLIAGSSGFRFRKFLSYDIFGEITWILLYGGLGYWFGSEWELVSNFISNFGGLILGLVILAVGIWLGRRRLRSIKDAKEKVPEA